jgi:hypothetical protein
MGWKKVKEHYNIKHIVCIADKGLCIGSAYIHDLIVIRLDGTFAKKYDIKSHANDELRRYQIEMDADPEKLKGLISEADTFEKSLPVYTYDGADIIEKQCEEYEWPNVTHDGELMYDNTFFIERNAAIEKAKESAKYGIDCYSDRLESLRKDIEKASNLLEIESNNLLKLQAMINQPPTGEEDM